MLISAAVPIRTAKAKGDAMSLETSKVIRWLECLASGQYYSRGNEPVPEFVPSVVRMRVDKLVRRFDPQSQTLVDFKRLRAGDLLSVETTMHGRVFLKISADDRKELQPDEFDVHEMRINQKRA